METNTSANLTGIIARHWYLGLAALLLAVLMIAWNGEGSRLAQAEGTGCAVTGDLNGDCAVSGQDLFVLLVHYGETGSPIPGSGGFSCSSPIMGDLTNDCAVAGNDLFVLLQNFGKVA